MSYYKGKPLFVLEGAGTRCYGGIRKGVPIKEKKCLERILDKFRGSLFIQSFPKYKVFLASVFFFT